MKLSEVIALFSGKDLRVSDTNGKTVGYAGSLAKEALERTVVSFSAKCLSNGLTVRPMVEVEVE